jgi:hypothetical protein
MLAYTNLFSGREDQVSKNIKIPGFGWLRVTLADSPFSVIEIPVRQ